MSTLAIPVSVALVDESGQVPLADLQKLAGALNEQLLRDFCPVWQAKGSVTAYDKSVVPSNTWAVRIQSQLDQPGALGYHTDSNNVPYALVEYTSDYAVTVSHELLEMLADPWGNRMHAAELPQGIQPSQVGLTNANQQVSYLLEVCDPCESKSYSIGGLNLSDFLFPEWYYTTPQPCSMYTRTGYCTEPRQVQDGGYVSFCTPDGNWWQVFNESGSLSVQNLGNGTSAYGSLREFTDAKAREYRASKQQSQ